MDPVMLARLIYNLSSLSSVTHIAPVMPVQLSNSLIRNHKDLVAKLAASP